MNKMKTSRILFSKILIPLASVLALGSCSKKPILPQPAPSSAKTASLSIHALTFPQNAGVIAMFNAPNATAIDVSGNIYIVDTKNNRIRKITPGGTVSTIAGNGIRGFSDGPGATAEFNFPGGIAVDRSKNVYVADGNNNRIRMITPAGVVSTYAGTGVSGSRNGAGDSAQFSIPAGLAIDGNGNIYVADEANRMIRKITRNRVVSTVAGNGIFGYVDGPGASAEFSNPEFIASDAPGNLYVTDGLNNKIRKITRAGVVSTLAGTGEAGILDGPAAAAKFHLPTGITVDAAGNLYVSDEFNNRIRKITPAGDVSTLTGHGNGLTPGGFADGTPDKAVFSIPKGLSVGTDGTLYLADLDNQRIRKIDPAGLVSTLAGTGDAAFADGRTVDVNYGNPEGVYCDAARNIFVVDAGHHRIMKITPAGVVSTVAGSGLQGFQDATGTAAQFSFPSSITGDASGNLYVADLGNGRIRVISPAGVVSTLAGSGNGSFQDGQGASAKFNAPSGIAIDAAGNLYVADEGNHRIRKVTPGGLVSTIAGDGNAAFRDGAGTVAEFHFPQDVAVDGLGNVYVADRGNNRIRKISPAGMVSTFAGDGVAGFKDGAGAVAEFNIPMGITVDRSRNVYVADINNNRIRKISPAGMVSSFAGNGAEGCIDGPAAGAEFAQPFDVAIDGNGNIYITEQGNDLVRKISPAGVVIVFSGSGIFFVNV